MNRVRLARLLAPLGVLVAVACVLLAISHAEQVGPPFSFPGCTQHTEATVDCGYSSPEDDVPPNCERPDAGGQLTCYPGGLSAQSGLADDDGFSSAEEPQAPDDSCLAPGTPEFSAAGCDGSSPTGRSDVSGADCVDPGPCNGAPDSVTPRECPVSQEDEDGGCPVASLASAPDDAQASGSGQAFETSNDSVVSDDDTVSAAARAEGEAIQAVQLARTGFDARSIALLGGCLVVMGLVLSRRRRAVRAYSSSAPIV